MRRRLLPPVLVASVLLAGCATTSAGSHRAARSTEPALAVNGYALSDLPASVLARDGEALTTVGIDGVTLDAGGSRVGKPERAAYSLATRARAQGIRSELLVSNFHGADFSPAIGHLLLSDPAHRATVVRQLASYVGPDRFDGIAVDLESLGAGDAAGLTAFVQALRAALPGRASISIALMAATSTSGYADRGYDLGQLAKAVDVVALMTYDEHGPGWSGPGPIGALSWQRKALAALTSVVAPSKVDLGVAGYGYTWPITGTGHDLSPRAARALARRDGVAPAWDAAVGEWRVRLTDGTRLWWSDRRSWDLRVRLAKEQHLHGLALWRLGSADAIA